MPTSSTVRRMRSEDQADLTFEEHDRFDKWVFVKMRLDFGGLIESFAFNFLQIAEHDVRATIRALSS